jgi:hypothetical protein
MPKAVTLYSASAEESDGVGHERGAVNNASAINQIAPASQLVSAVLLRQVGEHHEEVG